MELDEILRNTRVIVREHNQQEESFSTFYFGGSRSMFSFSK